MSFSLGPGLQHLILGVCPEREANMGLKYGNAPWPHQAQHLLLSSAQASSGPSRLCLFQSDRHGSQAGGQAPLASLRGHKRGCQNQAWPNCPPSTRLDSPLPWGPLTPGPPSTLSCRRSAHEDRAVACLSTCPE